MNDITAEERESLENAFEIFDRDHDGVITVYEFGDILKSLGVSSQDKDLNEILNSVDSNKDGRIDFKEFVAAMVKYMPHQQTSIGGAVRRSTTQKSKSYPPLSDAKKRISYHEEDDLRECFKAFDKNGDGFISEQELAEVMCRLGEKLSPEEIKDMMHEADVNKDGQIDFTEFKKLIPPSD
ncbi:hypothetical protein VTP01DRAFT_6286 [Rhizomucor pusillus]|uniref:uncharacterized protein n=1 Tax=Rhizomucor pusillus TaxID=4840 RepID=UPI003743BAA3